MNAAAGHQLVAVYKLRENEDALSCERCGRAHRKVYEVMDRATRRISFYGSTCAGKSVRGIFFGAEEKRLEEQGWKAACQWSYRYGYDFGRNEIAPRHAHHYAA